MTKDEFITERTRIVSEMLDNPDKYGIYPTTKCFEALDALFDKINPIVSDEEIRRWAENQRTAYYDKFNLIEGAKAMRDNKIKTK
jgi:hypothetical protein